MGKWRPVSPHCVDYLEWGRARGLDSPSLRSHAGMYMGGGVVALWVVCVGVWVAFRKDLEARGGDMSCLGYMGETGDHCCLGRYPMVGRGPLLIETLHPPPLHSPATWGGGGTAGWQRETVGSCRPPPFWVH